MKKTMVILLILSMLLIVGCQPQKLFEVNNDLLKEGNISCYELCINTQDLPKGGNPKTVDGRIEYNSCVCYDDYVCDDFQDKCCN